MKNKTLFTHFKKFITFAILIALSLGTFAIEAKQAQASDAIISSEYIDADGDGTVDHLKWIFDENVKQCDFEAGDWSDDNTGDFDIAITGINEGGHPEGTSVGDCDDTDPVLYISVTADSDVTAGTTSAVSYDKDAGTMNDLLFSSGIIGDKNDIVQADGASGELETITMEDSNSNGKIDRIVVKIDNAGDKTGHVYTSDGWVVTDDGNDVSISSVTLANSTADPLVFNVNLNETDGDLTVDTLNADLQVSYTQQGLNLGTEYFLGTSEILAITSTNPTDAAPPAPVSATFYDDIALDGIIDRIRIIWSEDINTTGTAGDWSVSGADFTGLSIDDADCGGNDGEPANACDIDINNSTSKTNVGNLQLSYSAGASVTDGTNNALSASFTSASTPALVDAADPYPLSAEFFDADGDGKVELITVDWTETLAAVTDGSADWAVSSASNFSDLVEGTVECNNGGAAANECDYNFTTSTVKTNVGDLTIDYTAGTSVKDTADNTAPSVTLNSGSTVPLADMAAPTISQIGYIDADYNGSIDTVELLFSEAIWATSVVAPDDLIFTNVGDFTSAAFGSSTTDTVTSNGVGFATIPLGTASTVVDTLDDSGNLAVSTQNNFSIVDAVGNTNSTLAAQSQNLVKDVAAPVIKDFQYEDADDDGQIDQFQVTFSEPVDAASTLSPSALIFSTAGADVGDFTAAVFGASATDAVTTTTSTATIPLGTEATAVDTAEGSGTISIDTQAPFYLIDTSGNDQMTYSTQTHTTFTDGAAPAPKSATFYDPDTDGMLDLLTVVWSEVISPVADGKSEWAISSASDFVALTEGTVTCGGSGVEATDECDYNFLTSTKKTDVGDLSLAYTPGSVTDGTTSAVAQTFTSASTVPLTDGAAPVFVSATADSDTNINIVMTEPVNAVTWGAAADWNATGITSAAAAVSGGTIDLTVGSIGNTAYTATDFAFDTANGGDIQDAATNATLPFSGKSILDGQVPTVTAGNLDIDDSACTGTGGECIVGDTMTFSWDNGTDGNTDVAMVTADLTAFGGSATQQLYDNAQHGDSTAFDDIFTYDYTVLADDDDGTYGFTVTATDSDANASGAVASTDTADVDDEPPVIATPGTLVFSAGGDVNTNGLVETGDTLDYADGAVASADGDSFTIDLSTLTGDAAATSGGNPHTVVPGILNATLYFSEKAIDDAGNETTGLMGPLTVDNATGSGFTSASVGLGNLIQGQTTFASVSLDSTLDLPIDGKIEVVFPSGFTISGVSTATNLTGIDGTFTIVPSGSTVTLTRNGDGTVLTGGTTASFRLNSVVNPLPIGTTGSFGLTTKNAANVTLSSISTVPGVTITIDPTPAPSSGGGGGGGGGGGSSSGGGGGGGGGSYLAGVTKKTSDTSSQTTESESTGTSGAGLHGSAPASITAFADTFGHWAESYISRIAELGIVQGKSPTQYAPNDNISRAEILKIAVNSFKLAVEEKVAQNPLPDVDVDAWYAPYVKSAFENGIIYGFDSGLNPNAPASRGLAATILVKAAGFQDVDQNFFQNYSSHADWTYAHFPDVAMDSYYAPFVTYLYDKGIISGYEDGTFGGGNPITRAEIAKIVVNILDIYAPEIEPVEDVVEEAADESAEEDTEETEEVIDEEMMEGQGLGDDAI